MIMADIKIYGKLKNDTDGILAEASQILDTQTGKNLSERISEIEEKVDSGGSPSQPEIEYYTESEVMNILNSLT